VHLAEVKVERRSYLRVARGTILVPAVVCSLLAFWAVSLLRDAYSTAYPLVVTKCMVAMGAIFVGILIALGAVRVATTKIDAQMVSQWRVKVWPLSLERIALPLSRVESFKLLKNKIELCGDEVKISVNLSFYSHPAKVIEYLKKSTGHD
jgi:hypothetical protein